MCRSRLEWNALKLPAAAENDMQKSSQNIQLEARLLTKIEKIFSEILVQVK